MRRIVAAVLVGVLLVAAVPQAQASPAHSLYFRVIRWPSPAVVGQYTRVMVETDAYASCVIRVWYASGSSRARGLEAKTADERGIVRWVWFVGTSTTPGTFDIEVGCLTDYDDVYVDLPFTVSR